MHENALLADLPSLKALMTTRDRRTIDDGATEFWQVSESDLFALADSDGVVVTVKTREAGEAPHLAAPLQQLLGSKGKHYVIAGPHLFDIAVRPLFFGSEGRGSLLGYVLSGYAVDRSFVDVISQAAGVQAAFLSGRQALAGTLMPAPEQQLASGTPSQVSIGGEDYLATETDLSKDANGPLRLAVLKSLAESHRAARDINRLVLLLGVAGLLFGTTLMLALSRMVTRPLELLADGVRAFGFGDAVYVLPRGGTQEVRELSNAFARMRREILDANEALLESERLATIGRMASSISHDFRHYLAAVYANAEFLSSPRLSEAERNELFAEIQIAVHGTTELIDSLLIFSKGGARLQRAAESMITVAERAIAMMKAHPESEGVTVDLCSTEPAQCIAVVDAKQLERAVYNLLLNACQSARHSSAHRCVHVHVAAAPSTIVVTVTDSGAGVAEAVRASLFEPFVSEGKQSGTGLGLTLAQAIAAEHGGAVTLVSTRPGEAVFQLSVQRNFSQKLTQTPPPSRIFEGTAGETAGLPASATLGE